MASIKKINARKYKITVSNGYRPDGRKISRAKTINVPDSVHSRSIQQYVAHEAEEFERIIKTGYCEDGEMTFQEYASRWLERQTKYALSTLGFYRRSLEAVYPYIGNIKLNRLRPIALENLLVELRKRIFRGKSIQETTVQKYQKRLLAFSVRQYVIDEIRQKYSQQYYIQQPIVGPFSGATHTPFSMWDGEAF